MHDNFTVAVTGQSLIKHDVRQNDRAAFEAMQSLLQRADLAFTNFEGTILGRHGGWPLKGSFFGSSDPVVLDALKTMGFGALSLSNNHAFDLGPPGVLSTLEEVESRGFLHAGLGRNHTEAGRARAAIINGRDVAIVAMDGGPGPDFMYAANAETARPERPGVNRLLINQLIEVDAVAFDHIRNVGAKVGYSPIDLANDSQPDDPRHPDPACEVVIARAVFKRSDRFGRTVKIDDRDMSRNLSAISAAAETGCLVIAYLHHHHWAADWYQVPDWVGRVARQCIDAGAAMFVSHGAPVLQPIEIYRQRPIFYSLGNFIFHVRSEKSTWTAPEVWESVIGQCSFDPRGNLTGMILHPIIIGGEEALNGQLERRIVPHLAKGASAERILRRLQAQSAEIGTVFDITGETARLRI